MLSKTNIEIRLKDQRSRRISEESILEEVQQIFKENLRQRKEIVSRLNIPSEEENNAFDLDKLETNRIFHLKDLQKICVTYRLRFLEARFFKGGFPEEAISEIRRLELDHDTKLGNFKIMAPSRLLKLENADDPLLFVPLGNDYFYLIHKWGTDLHPLRKWLMWPYKNFENLIFAVFVVSLLLTAMTPMQLFTKGEVNPTEYLLMFLFMFKAVGGIVLFYGFSKGKNFNEAIWNSKYYNA